MAYNDEDRKPTLGEILWGLGLIGIIGLYVAVVALRPLYDLLTAA